MASVLVTGSSGFIGSQLCKALAARGDAVRAFHRPHSSLAALHSLPVEHAIGDVLEPRTLALAMQGVEYVFHAAASLGRNAAADQQHRVTIEGTRIVLAAAAKAGVRRVVHTSSVAALGVPAGREPIDENHNWNFPAALWPYGYAKNMAEREVQTAVANGLDVVIVNPAVVLGPGDLNRISGNVIIQIARRRLPVSISGGLNVVHIDEVIAGHLAALERGRVGERYLLSGENLTHTAFLTAVARATGVRPPLLAVPGRPLRTFARPLGWLCSILRLPLAGRALHRAGVFFYYSNAKARRELEISLVRPASQAISDAAGWYRQAGVISA